MNKIIACPVNGFVNRMRNMASCYAVSCILGKSFEIMWNHSEDHPKYQLKDNQHPCGLDFNQFVESHPQSSLKVNDLDFNFQKLRGTGKKIVETEDRIFIQFNEHKYLDLIADSQKDVVVVGGGHLLKAGKGKSVYDPSIISENSNSIINPYHYISGVCSFYKFFPSKNWIQDIIYNKASLCKRALGVQIRVGDFMNAPHSPWFGKNLTEDDVINIFKKHIDQQLLTGKFESIYITSDSLYVLNKIQNDYKGKVFFFPKNEIKRDCHRGVVDAYIDWQLLSYCPYILYTKFSSFGAESCFRIGIDYQNKYFTPVGYE